MRTRNLLPYAALVLGMSTAGTTKQKDYEVGDEVQLQVASACLGGQTYPAEEMALLEHAIEPRGRQYLTGEDEKGNFELTEKAWVDDTLKKELACAWLNVSRTLDIQTKDLAQEIEATQLHINAWHLASNFIGPQGSGMSGPLFGLYVKAPSEQVPYITFHELTHQLLNGKGVMRLSPVVTEGVAEWITSIGFPESEMNDVYGGYTFLATLLGTDVPKRCLMESDFYEKLQVDGSQLWQEGEIQKRVRAFAEKNGLSESETFELFSIYNTDYKFPYDESIKMRDLDAVMQVHGWDWRAEADQTAPNNNLQMKWALYAEEHESK